MPGESTRRPPRLYVLEGGLGFEIRERDGDVRVTLSGVLDRPMLQRLVAAVRPRLRSRDCRIVLDGRGLDHLDFRAVRDLVAWHRGLRDYGHTLLLAGWRPYHRAILILGDQYGEAAALRIAPSAAAGRTGAS
jgi:anti-anti-sigma regulatory factor